MLYHIDFLCYIKHSGRLQPASESHLPLCPPARRLLPMPRYHTVRQVLFACIVLAGVYAMIITGVALDMHTLHPYIYIYNYMCIYTYRYVYITGVCYC